ncbi:MAG: glycoside hydrolase family 2 TIM barrel-domain containing protein [Bacteroidota bacterium]|nr:glycoside hydrolase family 2 TIM barrel-domain containing protein [Bacteroidota bacterium]
MQMRKSTVFCFLLLLGNHLLAQKNSWHMVKGKITTPWADSVNPLNVLPEYPRPQMKRDNWTNLNGLWQYTVLPESGDENIPASFRGNILVPFAIESALSGVGTNVGKDSILWYQRTITVPGKRKEKRILLHFGAIDWRSDIYVNGAKVASHEGGYDPFTVDITNSLHKGTSQQLSIRVWDPTDDGPQPHGKQVAKPHGIWYTSVTGIWQTVWMEIVPETYIISTRQTPDIDNQNIRVSASIQNLKQGDEISISAWKGNEKIAEKTGADTAGILTISNPELWSPSHPFLYDLKISIIRKAKVIDEVTSYFTMRKISIAPDKNGIQKMMLNNAFLFEFGPLDQGWWPDGLYTAPTDGALKSDIEKLKEMGFNMIRKHVKVEPARWYYDCDQLGMLVWQDMPSGDLGNHWEPRPGVLGKQTDRQRTPESEGYYRKEWNAIMDALYNFPCIVVWVPFNEAWGQFKTVDITNWTMQKDPSRLVNSASGGNYYDVGQIVDLHNYPDPAMPRPELFGAKQALVLGEFGGLGLPVDGHTWQQKSWGYQSFQSRDSLFERYSSLINRLEELIKKGLSAAVYTQTTDVETEVNGFMTYDRKVIKMPVDKLKKANQKVYTVF